MLRLLCRPGVACPALFVALGPMPLDAQANPADLQAVEQTFDRSRRELRHGELIARYRELGDALDDSSTATTAQTTVQTIAQRISVLTVELSVLEKAGPIERSRAQPIGDVVATIARLDNNPEEEIALAEFSFLCGLDSEGEDALGRARDRDPRLKDHTDRILARARGERVPRGGYHRYRGLWLPLERRDRARAVDTALETLEGVGLDGVELPFRPDRERTNVERFDALGSSGPEALRQAAAIVRAALRTDYREVRSWLSSYAQHPKLREQILAAHAAMAPVRADALALIRRYGKDQQPQVDAFRARLEGMYSDYENLIERDRRSLQRVRHTDAHALLERVRNGERALQASHALLARWAKPGLAKVDLHPDAGTDVGRQRRLPGREQSELEDVLWLLVHSRAGFARDVVERATDLRRHHAELTAWELWLSEELLADAVEQFNDAVATSLDRVEQDFVERLNRYRRVLGLRPFEIDERCVTSARKHSQEMVDLGYFGHVSPVPRNRTPSDRVRLEGYSGGVGENCLVGGGAIAGPGAFEAWYHSPGHHRNLISGGIHVGVGAADGHRMWTMVAGGADLAWRGLHRDLPPERHAALAAAAEELALSHRVGDEPTKSERRRQSDALARAKGLVPEILPEVARLAFPASMDPRDPNHPAAPCLLRFLVEADVRTTWRTLQVAAVAASIDCMRHGGATAVRRGAFEVVEPLCVETSGYDPALRSDARRDAVLAIRRHWEDDAQWRFRQIDPADPRPIPGRTGDGPSLESPLEVLRKPERLRLARRHGGGTRTEQAIDRALAWLARVQDEDGAWRGRSFVTLSRDFEPRKAGIGNADHEIAMTGLAVLAYVTSGHTTQQGDYTAVVQRAADYLLQNIVDYGKFDTLASHYMYSHAIATQALAELYGYTADPRIGLGAQLALDYIAWAQHRPSGGWRYNANQHGDTSVTGWVVMALNAGYKAGLDVAGFRDALRFVDSVTQPGYYQVGYTGRPGLARENLRLTSVGMVCRLFLGESPEAPPIAMPCWRLLQHPPQKRGADFYYWYYASLAIFQRGGRFWKEWNTALKPAVLELQVVDRGSPYHGSWNPDAHHGRGAGRIYQTALGVLILTTYYRYDRAPKLKMHPFTGNVAEVAAPYIATLRDTDDPRLREITLSKLCDSLGPSLVGEIVRMIRDDDESPELRKLLAQSLITIARPQHQALLLPLLDHPDGHVVEHAARALVSISSAASLPALTKALRHPSHNVRTFAARALGRIGDAGATDSLTEQLGRERHGGTKRELQAALRRIAHRDATSVVVEDALGERGANRLAILEGLDLLESAGIGERLLQSKTRERSIYRNCLAALREHQEASAVPILLELLSSDDLDTRTESVKLLRALTGRQFQFDPIKPDKDRARAIERWNAWWTDNRGGYGSARK